MNTAAINRESLSVYELYLYGKGYVSGHGFTYAEIGEILGVPVTKIGRILRKERQRFMDDPVGRAQFWQNRGQEWWFALYLPSRDAWVHEMIEDTEKVIHPITQIEKTEKEKKKEQYHRIVQNYLQRKEQRERIRSLVCFI